MSFEYSDRICPFWLLFNEEGVLINGCSVSDEFCSFKFAKERFLNCGEYFSEFQNKLKKQFTKVDKAGEEVIKKYKRAIKGG